MKNLFVEKQKPVNQPVLLEPKFILTLSVVTDSVSKKQQNGRYYDGRAMTLALLVVGNSVRCEVRPQTPPSVDTRKSSPVRNRSRTTDAADLNIKWNCGHRKKVLAFCYTISFKATCKGCVMTSSTFRKLFLTGTHSITLFKYNNDVKFLLRIE